MNKNYTSKIVIENLNYSKVGNDEIATLHNVYLCDGYRNNQNKTVTKLGQCVVSRRKEYGCNRAHDHYLINRAEFGYRFSFLSTNDDRTKNCGCHNSMSERGYMLLGSEEEAREFLFGE